MDTLPKKCEDIDSVSSFCDCVTAEEPVDPAAKAFCNRAKTDKNITAEDLADLKSVLTDQEEEGCCCEC